MTDGYRTKNGFTVLPFGIDGQPVGSGFWEFAKLSPKWIEVCKTRLSQTDPCFDAVWDGDLSHVRTRFTSASGAATGTFFVNGQIASSFLLLSGLSPSADSEVARLFIESLRQTNVVRAATGKDLPFARVEHTSDRPLMVVVPWPNRDVSARDNDLVRELGVHLAAAFFSLCLEAKSS